MTNPATLKVRKVLEQMWGNYTARVDRLDYELVVLAIPKFPANIEAVASRDMNAVAGVFAEFCKARTIADVNELEPFKPAAEGSPEQAGEDEHATEVRPAPDDMGKGDDRRGPPTERDQPPAEANEDHAAKDTLDLTDRTKSRPYDPLPAAIEAQIQGASLAMLRVVQALQAWSRFQSTSNTSALYNAAGKLFNDPTDTYHPTDNDAVP